MKENIPTGLKRRREVEALQPRDRHLPDRSSLRGREPKDTPELKKPTLTNGRKA